MTRTPALRPSRRAGRFLSLALVGTLFAAGCAVGSGGDPSSKGPSSNGSNNGTSGGGTGGGGTGGGGTGGGGTGGGGTGGGGSGGGGSGGSGTLLVVGPYDITSQFNLLDALPPDVETALKYAFEFTQSPGTFLLDMAGQLPVIKYVIDALNLFSGIKTKVVAQIDDYINTWSGGLLTTVSGISTDIENALKSLKTHHRWTIYDPNAMGISTVTDTMRDITFTYKMKDFSYPQYAKAETTGQLTGLQFKLNAHTYDKGLNIGGILVDLIDNVILPQLTGVDSLGALFNQLVNCGGVGSWVWKEIALVCIGNTCISQFISANDIAKLCTNALNGAGHLIEDKIAALDAPGMMSVSDGQSLILEQRGMTGHADTIMGGTWNLTIPIGVGTITMPGQYTGLSAQP